MADFYDEDYDDSFNDRAATKNSASIKKASSKDMAGQIAKMKE